MRSQREIRGLFARSRVTVDSRLDERTMHDVHAALDTIETPESAPGEPKIWRITMSKRATKIAVAAAVVLAVLTGIAFLGGSPDGTAVAWAEVARNMETIHSYTCSMTSWQEPADGSAKSEKTMQFWYSNEYGFKMEQSRAGVPSLTVCMLRESNEGIRLWPQKKNYVRAQLSEEDRAMMAPVDMDPRQWVRLFMDAEYKSLGRDVIDGVTVEGVEITDPRVIRKSAGDGSITDFAARLWIDVQTQLPIRLEEEYTYNGMRGGGDAEKFQWNPSLTAVDLEPDIPADFVNLAQ